MTTSGLDLEICYTSGLDLEICYRNSSIFMEEVLSKHCHSIKKWDNNFYLGLSHDCDQVMVLSVIRYIYNITSSIEDSTCSSTC